MIVAKAEQVAAYLRQRKAAGFKDRRGRVPRGRPPLQIERAYARALRDVVGRMSIAFAPMIAQLPSMLENVRREARADSWFELKRMAGVRLDAGEGRRVRDMVDDAKSRMNSAIVANVDELAAQFAGATSAHGRRELNRQTRAALGADVFIQDRGLASMMERFVDANVGLVKGLTDEQAGKIQNTVLRAVQDAKPYSQLAAELEERFDITERRAVLIARDQIGKFYGQTTAARHRELGISHFIWRTANDERVRDEHAALEGQRFAYNDPPSEGLPGEPIQCRCYADPDFGDILGLLDV